MYRLLQVGIVAFFVAALFVNGPAFAYTEKEIEDIFHKLDTNGDGKVTRVEYSANKVMIIYRRADPDKSAVDFEETQVSRSFFDTADTNHDGKLSPVEVMDALSFEAVDTGKKGYFTLDDLRRFMNRIGR